MIGSFITTAYLSRRKIISKPAFAYFGSWFLSAFCGMSYMKRIAPQRVAESSSTSPFANETRRKIGYPIKEPSGFSDEPATGFNNNPDAFKQEFTPLFSDDKKLDDMPAFDDGAEPSGDNRRPRPPMPERSVTYDELRARNRAGYRF